MADHQRWLTLVWLVGLLLVGQAQLASAQGILVGPDLADGAPKTLFESYEVTDYQLTVHPDEESSGWFDVGAGVLHVVGFVNNVLLWLCLGVLYGALTLLEWLLNLTVYRDSAPQIDAAVRVIAAEVFWPLISATVAIGAVIAYTRWRGDGRGFMSDLAWVIAATVLGMGFAAGPSAIMGQLDGVRQDLAASVTAGSAQFARGAANPVGFPQPPIGGDARTRGTRALVDSTWNSVGATTWCYAEFHDLASCRAAGAHALAQDEQWQQWMQVLDSNGAVPEFGANGDWIRGQDLARTGYLLILACITIPMGILLLRLVIAGLVAAVGLLLMLVVGLLFLTFWPIPGWFRETGTRYVVYTLGYQLQALFITVVVAGVMVGSTILTNLGGQYGFFVTAVLNLALLVAAAKARSWLDALTSTSGGARMGLAGAWLLTSTIRSVVSRARSAAGGAVSGGVGLVGATGRAATGAAAGPGWAAQAGGWSHRWGTRGAAVPGPDLLNSFDDGPIRASAERWPSEAGPRLGSGSRAALPAGSGARAGDSSASPPRAGRRTAASTGAHTGRKRVWVADPRGGLSPLETDAAPPRGRGGFWPHRLRRFGGGDSSAAPTDHGRQP